MFGIKELTKVLYTQQQKLELIEEKLDHSLEKLECLLSSDDLDDIYDKLTEILNDENRLEKVNLCHQTLDKFEDYMKNVDKLNTMVNEIKGIASMTRASLKSTDCTKRLKTSKKETST